MGSSSGMPSVLNILYFIVSPLRAMNPLVNIFSRNYTIPDGNAICIFMQVSQAVPAYSRKNLYMNPDQDRVKVFVEAEEVR